MANANEPRLTQWQDGDLVEYPLATAEVIYEGTHTCLNSGGYLVKADKKSGLTYAGVAYETADNSAGAAGDKTCRVKVTKLHEFTSSGLAQADVRKKVYVTDNQTVTTSAPTYDVYCGNIAKVLSATSCMVDIRPATIVGL